MTKNIEELEKQIEKMVGEHIAGCHEAARAAVDRAFGRVRQGTKPGRKTLGTRRSGSGHRSAEEMSELCERLVEAVRANPGEGIRVLMEEVGVTGRELEYPMIRLKRAGRVRSAGQRCSTRYFPMAEALMTTSA